MKRKSQQRIKSQEISHNETSIAAALQNNFTKTTVFIFAASFILLLMSCGQANDKKTVVVNHIDPAKTVVDRRAEEIPEKRKQVEDEENSDRINDDKILAEAIRIAKQHKANNRFRKNYITTTPDSSYSSYQVEVEISSDFYFSNEFPYLIIKRKTPATVYINIFSRANKKFREVLSYEKWTSEYTGDTIRDINGDGLKDFVANWYANTGCCLKGFSDVHLQRVDRKSFSNSFQFINPTFSPKEKIIRGVCYGHPGETEMYKYKWSKEAVDTLEYVYYEKNDKGEKTGKIIVSNNAPYHDDHKVLKRLSDIPVEYRKIEGYDWFTDNHDYKGKR